MCRHSQPGDPQLHGAIKGLNHRILSGVWELLIQAGLPYYWWLYAVRQWCFPRNLTYADGGCSPYEKQTGSVYAGNKLPLVVGVSYYPSPT